ncbi:RecQ family ATP-dependent DNA helicase [Amphritea sp. 1_MG-2023]|uniref:RecQ family ATP-dependent DNA helicase n=1 Tax=Amphritea sp. 1_MG-2023 TaxID=3062670 RepID=UPI0026E4884D|nr:RecQ family ATP-dependent DNA helicase [Amphritea sp. 1_MG-2023]MDO6564471.1 RecQ family ATP-dependent DNA helicase [Amphritea sp. 1_MG-2023]
MSAPLPDTLSQQLRQSFGFEGFRPGQEQTIRQLLQGTSSLAIFPTGSGKSLCYQLTALCLPHLTLVVSPLLALMKDQLAFLAEKGIPAASIDSTLSAAQSRQVMNDIRHGSIKVLMVSVERFKNERFRQFIQSIPVSMLVIDEAHCISEWGHNFRPDYLKLPAYREALNIPLVLLLTATATQQVKRDMASKFAIAEEHIVQTGFYRANLDLSVLAVPSREKNARLLEVIKSQQGAGIVYVTLQQRAEQVAAFLLQQGINASAYHAGFDDLKRQQIQADFMAGHIEVVVATIAFGMGIDKSNIRFVIHYDLPKSIENYSQEIGRAGRDGLPSNCITLANLDGLNTVENFVYGDTPELSGIEFLLNNIRRECQNGQWELQLNALSTASNIRQLPLKTLLVQLELRGVIQPLYAYFADFKYKLLQPKEQILERFEGERQDFLAAVFANTAFKRVWGTLAFETLLQRYRCDRQRIVAALDYLQAQGLIELETKKLTDVYQVNQSRLDDATLAQQLYDYFLDKEHKEIARIAALVKFFELKDCLSHHLARYFDDHQSAEHCGHCSACRGQSVTLEYSASPCWPTDEQLIRDLAALRQHLTVPLSVDTQCRFLAGISVPLFTRHKVRQLQGFGCCEAMRYADIRDKIAALLA